MIQLFVSFLTIISSIIFLQMNHPLAMGLMLLLQTVLISLITGLMTSSFWFSYILFLIFLGGMLVLFIYVTSLASNEMFSISLKLMLIMMIMSFMFILFMLLIDKQIITSFIQNNKMMKMSSLNSFMPENSIPLIKLYNFPTNIITLMLINYLLITLVASVKVTNIFKGPLRHSN